MKASLSASLAGHRFHPRHGATWFSASISNKTRPGLTLIATSGEDFVQPVEYDFIG
jgi:hypothetical protein